MITNLLYIKNDYLESFEATVVNIDDQSLTLDATAFYPTGGHQACDQGRIEIDSKNYVIIDKVQKDDDTGVVHHYFSASKGVIRPGDKVKCQIDWHRRYRHMQLHNAQHIFSHCALNRFSVETRRGDFSPEVGLVVMDKPLTWEQCVLLENDVNIIIKNDESISRLIGNDGTINLLIGNLDNVPCGGTHVKSTSEIGLFIITNIQGCNIYFEVGKTAERMAIRLSNVAVESSNILGLDKPESLVNAIKDLSIERDALKQRLVDTESLVTRSLVSEAIKNGLRIGSGAFIVKLDVSHLKTKVAKTLLEEICKKDMVIICLASARSLMIFSLADNINANAILQTVCKKWNIRGGGGPKYAQGGPVPEEISDPLGEIVGLM